MCVYRTSGHLPTFVKGRDWAIPFECKSEDRGIFATIITAYMQFQGGILDFRGLDEFMEREEVPVDPELGRCYTAILKPIVDSKNYQRALPFWQVICHALQSTEASKMMRKLLLEWTVVESRYVSVNCETYLLSPAVTKKENGLTIFVMHPKTSSFVWPILVSSAERYKKVGRVREYGIFDYELRMEVYMDFISKLPKKDEGIEYVLCIAAGRKCIIAAYVSFLPLAQCIA